ncbi:MAG: hypothetical protein U1F16_08235 [Turneriella sp.]
MVAGGRQKPESSTGMLSDYVGECFQRVSQSWSGTGMKISSAAQGHQQSHIRDLPPWQICAEKKICDFFIQKVFGMPYKFMKNEIPCSGQRNHTTHNP